MIHTPHVDWFSISTILALLGSSFVALRRPVLVPAAWRRRCRCPRLLRIGDGRRRPLGLAVREQRAGHRVIANSFYRDRWTALSQVLICGIALVDRARRRRPRPRARVGVLRAPARVDGRHGVLRRRGEPDDDVPLARAGSRSRSTSCARVDYKLEGSLEAGLEVPRRRVVRIRGAAFRVGTRVRRDEPDRLPRDRGGGAVAQRPARARPRDDHRRPRVQVVVGAVPHVDAGRLPGRADDGDGVHVGGDEGGSLRAHPPDDADGVPAGGRTCGRGRSPGSRSRRS